MAKKSIWSDTNLLRVVKIGGFSVYNMEADEVLVEIGLGSDGAELFLPPVVDAAGRVYSFLKPVTGWPIIVKRFGTDSCSIYRGAWGASAAKDVQFTWTSGSPIVLYSDGFRWYVLRDGTTTWP